MKSKRLLTFYGLKWNPFLPEIPVEGLCKTPKIDNFCFRVENLVMDGGFAMITGESGTGKSVILRILADRLSNLREVIVGEMTRPQSGLCDFYRELGGIFGLEFKISNKWGSYKAIRDKWLSHIESTLFRPILLIDEAQEIMPSVLSELRFLSSTNFDSKSILTIVLCGDMRLPDKFRIPELVPLGSRIKTRLVVESSSRDDLANILYQTMEKAGNPKLMNKPLVETLADHSAGNYRVLMNTANELLASGLHQEIPQLNEKLFLEFYDLNSKKHKTKKR